MTYLLPGQLLRSWQRVAVCPAALVIGGVSLWCHLAGGHVGCHRHDDIEWLDDDPLASE